jgi:tyrosine-protein kinase Etk/Wzc
MNPRAKGQVLELEPPRGGGSETEETTYRGARGPGEPWSLRELLLTLRRGRWAIAGGAACGLVLALAYLTLATPSYSASALVQVENRTWKIAGLEELAGVFGEKTPADVEIEIVRSRALLGAVVDQLGLDVSAEPRTFPIVGRVLARRHPGPAPASAPLGLERYAWGGERITVTRLEVPEELLGQRLRLVAKEGGYQVRDRDGVVLVNGVVGAAARSAGGEIRLFVSELRARPGTEFDLVRRPRSAVIDELQLHFRVYERVKKTGMLVLELSGPSPSRVMATVAAIASTYLRQNVERRSAESTKTLAFLESQLPIVKSSLDAAEARLGAYRLTRGTVDLSKETATVIARSAEIEQAISAMELQRAELRQQYTDKHPTLLALTEKMERLRDQRGAMASRLRGLPTTELETARLERDVKVGSELYLLLLNRAQELRVVKSGTVGNVRIVDQPEVPLRPFRPLPAPVVLVGLILGLAAGVTLTLARRALHDVLDDPLDLERGTGLAVYAAIPYSAAEAALRRAARGGARWPPLAQAAPEDPAVESLRSLRSALPFALVDAPSNIVMISSAAPGAGKSFVAINLALLLAAADRRVLLIDGDLRRGRLHRHLGRHHQPGLSDLIRGTALQADVARRVGSTSLDFVACGTTPPNPAEILASPRLPQLLAELAAGYDFVVVDTAPVLAVTDPTLVSKVSGACLLVVEAGHDTLPDLKTAMDRFAQCGTPVSGAIMNGTRALPSAYERYGRYATAYAARRPPE